METRETLDTVIRSLGTSTRAELNRLNRQRVLLIDARRALALGEYPSVVKERLRCQGVNLGEIYSVTLNLPPVE